MSVPSTDSERNRQPERWSPFTERERAQIALGLVAAMLMGEKPTPRQMIDTVDLLEEISDSLGMDPYPGLDGLRERLMALVANGR